MTIEEQIKPFKIINYHPQVMHNYLINPYGGNVSHFLKM